MEIAFCNTERASSAPEGGTSVTAILLTIAVTVTLIAIGYFACVRFGVFSPPDVGCCIVLDLDFDYGDAGQ